jgi:hypothetical protein
MCVARKSTNDFDSECVPVCPTRLLLTVCIVERSCLLATKRCMLRAGSLYSSYSEILQCSRTKFTSRF